ncbi:MAG: hypothetical protein ACETVZ_07370 [Phycisphaerae bacterium]
MEKSLVTRRDFFHVTAAATVATICSVTPQAAEAAEQKPKPGKQTVRDKLWIWGHPVDYHYGKQCGIYKHSRMTPLEAAIYLGTPNIFMADYKNSLIAPYDQYALPLHVMKRVVWSIAWQPGTEYAEGRRSILDMSAKWAELEGVILNMFLMHADMEPNFPLRKYKEIRKQFSEMDLWLIAAPQAIVDKNRPYIDLCDGLVLFKWQPNALKNVEGDFANLEKHASDKERVQLCCLWDYANKRPMPVETMKYQCKLGLKMLGDGRSHGMVFLASCICDLGLEAVEWTRKWIAEVGDRSL